jgi:hypothetical protein
MTTRKRSRRTGFSVETCGIIDARAHGRCERCGIVTTLAQRHHRKPRGMGGTRDPAINSPANGLRVCLKCHNFLERMERGAAYVYGWLVYRMDNPATVPIKMWDGRWYVLNDDGSKREVPIPQGLRRGQGEP